MKGKLFMEAYFRIIMAALIFILSIYNGYLATKLKNKIKKSKNKFPTKNKNRLKSLKKKYIFKISGTFVMFIIGILYITEKSLILISYLLTLTLVIAVVEKSIACK